MNKLKEQLKNAETTKAQVLAELEKSKRTAEDLTQKLKVITESRELAVQATEASKSRVKQLKEDNCGNLDGTNGAWKEELETTVHRYKTLIAELDVAKQELRKVRQGCKESIEARVSALRQAEEAKDAMEASKERVSELSKDILDVQKSFEQMTVASVQAHQQQADILIEKDIMRQSYKATLEESEKKLLDLKKEFSLEHTKNLEVKLAETMNEIETLQKEMENKKTLDLDSLKNVTLELDAAKELLQKVSEEKDSLRSLVEALKADLENVKREHSELKEKERETQSIIANLHTNLQRSGTELLVYLAEESKVRGASREMILKLNQLSSETENAKREAEDMKSKEMEMKMEAEVTKLALEDAEIKLKVALEEAEAAKAAEASILDQIRVLSKTTSATHGSTSEAGARITISREEFESLSRKVEESDKLADIKVVAVTAQVEAVKASENDALRKLKATQKEIEDIKSATQEALRKADMAEAAKSAVESELKRWHEREQKKAAEAASRLFAETQMSSSDLSPQQHYRIQKQYSAPKSMEARKLEKGKVSVSKKILLPSISRIFHRKKNQVERGIPSYLPGEYPL